MQMYMKRGGLLPSLFSLFRGEITAPANGKQRKKTAKHILSPEKNIANKPPSEVTQKSRLTKKGGKMLYGKASHRKVRTKQDRD